MFRQFRSIPILFSAMLLLLVAPLRAGDDKAAPPKPVEKPFLWVIEGKTPNYLYGTIHLPDARVTALPEVVKKAFDSSDVVNTEIPLDTMSQLAVVPATQLPGGKTLEDAVGKELNDRFEARVQKSLGGSSSAAASAMVMMTKHSKPWVAMSQLELLEFMPDLMAGKKPLDLMLYNRAQLQSKEVGGVETAMEQLGYMDSMSADEQKRMLAASLDSLDDADKTGEHPSRELLDAYVAGDLDGFAPLVEKEKKHEPELQDKLMGKLIGERNPKMADRIAKRIADEPERVHFFAIGAMHYAGDEGLLKLLEARGLKTRRLTPADADSIKERPKAAAVPVTPAKAAEPAASTEPNPSPVLVPVPVP